MLHKLYLGQAAEKPPSCAKPEVHKLSMLEETGQSAGGQPGSLGGHPVAFRWLFTSPSRACPRFPVSYTGLRSGHVTVHSFLEERTQASPGAGASLNTLLHTLPPWLWGLQSQKPFRTSQTEGTIRSCAPSPTQTGIRELCQLGAQPPVPRRL